MSLSSNIAGYATPKRRKPWPAPPVWLKWVSVASALLVLPLFLLGLPPLAGAMEYGRNVAFSEVLDYAREQGIRGTFRSAEAVRVALFAPAAIIGLGCFIGLRGRAQRIAIIANIALPGFWLMHLWPLFAVAGPVMLVTAVFGQCDGETWSEGFICYAAMGSWTASWTCVALVVCLLKRIHSDEER